jgi:threonine synthase
MKRIEGARVFLKDEGVSPTGTFKARGMAVAVSKASELGIRKLAVPSAGNAGVALAAYAAAAGSQALVVAPHDTPPTLLREIVARGALCFLAGGTIDEAGGHVEEAAKAGYMSLATLREPYRIEGKKTMGLEVWEQLGIVPDWVVFPTGGGTGVVGLWKAFRELGELRWTDGRLPRICAVQSKGCPPVATAWQEGPEKAPATKEARTVATGLRVPRPRGLPLILKALKESKGLAMAVPEEEIPAAALAMAASEGVHPCYEGAVAYLGLQALISEGYISREDVVVVFNTGTGLINPEGAPPSLPTLRGPGEILGFLGG